MEPVPRTRQPGWARRYSELVVRQMSTPFSWGEHNCCSWAADVVMALHCHDTLAPLRKPCRSAREAMRAIRAAGGADVLTRCGLEPLAPGLARCADLVLMRQCGRELLAVCNGADALAPGALGLECLPMHLAVRAWST